MKGTEGSSSTDIYSQLLNLWAPLKARNFVAAAGSKHTRNIAGAMLVTQYDDVGIWRPDTGIYRHVAAYMEFTPEYRPVIDDGPVGVEAGYTAGMTTYFYNPLDEPYQFPGVISF